MKRADRKASRMAGANYIKASAVVMDEPMTAAAALSAMSPTLQATWSDAAREAAAEAKKNKAQWDTRMKKGSIVKFKNPTSPDEAKERYVLMDHPHEVAEHAERNKISPLIDITPHGSKLTFPPINTVALHELTLHEGESNKATDTTMSTNLISSHEVTGHTTMREHENAMRCAVNRAIQGDTRFMPSNAPAEEANSIKAKPYCVDITTPDSEGQHHAIIVKHDGKLVRHGFDFDREEGKATLHDGEPTETQHTSVYASVIAQHDLMVKATEETISCRGADGNGVKLGASEPWTPGKPVSYIYAPGGVTTINAGFRRNESITCTVQVDEQTAKDLQSSFDFVSSTNKQEPYADEDHESKKATLRFPPGKVTFAYGTHRGEEGVIVTGAEPTSYGAEAVNGKVYASWSPEFATDAEYSKAKSKKLKAGGVHWTFPDGVRGSESNPARIVGLSFVTGALTNKPAFKNMPNVKARHVEPEADNAIQASGTSEGVSKSWETRKQELGNHVGSAFTHRLFAATFKNNNRELAVKHAHLATEHAEAASKLVGEAEAGDKHLAHNFAANAHEEAANANGHTGNYQAVTHHHTQQEIHSRYAAAAADKSHPDYNRSMNFKATDATPSTTLTAAVPADYENNAGTTGYEQHAQAAARATEAAEAMSKAAKDPAGHRMAKDLHQDAMLAHRHAAAAAEQAGNAVKKKEHSEKADAHSQRCTDHFKQAEAQARTTATAMDDPILNRIFARNKQALDEANVIALRSPEVQARIAAENTPPDVTINTIKAREQAQHEWEASLLARNPLDANQAAIEAIAKRNGCTITATWSDESREAAKKAREEGSNTNPKHAKDGLHPLKKGDKLHTKFGSNETFSHYNEHGQVVTHESGHNSPWHPSNVWKRE